MITVIINSSLSLLLSNCLLDASSTYYLILFSINYIYLYNLILYWTILSYCSQAMLKNSNLISIHLIYNSLFCSLHSI